MSRRTRWTLRTFGPGVAFVVAGMCWLLAADVWLGVICVACGICMIFSGQAQRYAYRAGFWAGAIDVTSALQTGDSPILRGEHPEPWDHLTEPKSDRS